MPKLKKRDHFAYSNRLKSQVEIDLIQGNACQHDLFSHEFIDLTVISPPYNLGMAYNSNNDLLAYSDYLAFTKTWLKNVYNWTKPTGRLCLNIPLNKNKGGQQSVGADITIIAKDIGWQYHSTVVWNKQNISRRTAWGSWLSASAPYVIAPVELILILYKDCWKKAHKGVSDTTKDEFMAWTNGVWTFNGESAKKVGHPAPYPEELPLRCIKLFSYLKDCVFDPFLGSGTTGVVAQKLSRHFTGIELDKSYYELSEKRIKSQRVLL